MAFKFEPSILTSVLVIFVLCLTTNSYAALSSDSYSLRSSLLRTLSPLRRDVENFKRSPSTDSILPRSSVVLDYGYDTIDPTQVSVIVQAHQDQPILLLETLDPTLLQSVTCQPHPTLSGSIISLTMHSEEMVHAAARAWAANGDTAFNIITSHTGCNAANERGAWSVSSIQTRAQTVILLVSPLSLWEVGKTFEVSLRHSGISGDWEARAPPPLPRTTSMLAKRDFEGILTATLDSDLSGKQVFPGNSSALGLASDVIQDLTDASLTITCVECSSHFNYSFGVDFTFNPGQNVTAATMFSSVNRLEQDVLLDIGVATELQKDFGFDLVKIPVDGLQVPGLFAIGPFIGVAVEFNFTISASVDFTFGANATVPVNANNSLDLINPSNAKATGWDGVVFNTAPVRINSGAPNFTIGAALEPFIEFDLNFSPNKTGLTARLTQTLPALEVDFTSLGNVNSNCQPAGDNDFSFFGIAYQVDASVTLETTANVQVEDLPILESVGLDPAPSWDSTLFSHTFPLIGGNQGNTTGNCVIIADDGGNSTNATNSSATPTTSQHPAASGTLVGASSAIPTYNISKIQTYYDSHNKLYPPGITFQMLQDSGQQLPTDLQPGPSAPISTSPSGSGGSSSAAFSHGIGGKMDIYFVSFVCALASVAALI